MYGGVAITKSQIRTTYWIPSLRKITKTIMKNCFKCKQYRAKPYSNTKPGPLSKVQTELCNPFQAAGLDYAGLIYYRYKSTRAEVLHTPVLMQ